MQGKYLVLAGLKGMNGQLEFVSGEDMEVLDAAEHFLAAEIEWDPTGRYVATAVTAMQKMENGVNLWLFNGQLIYRYPAYIVSNHCEVNPRGVYAFDAALIARNVLCLTSLRLRRGQ